MATLHKHDKIRRADQQRNQIAFLESILAGMTTDQAFAEAGVEGRNLGYWNKDAVFVFALRLATEEAGRLREEVATVENPDAPVDRKEQALANLMRASDLGNVQASVAVVNYFDKRKAEEEPCPQCNFKRSGNYSKQELAEYLANRKELEERFEIFIERLVKERVQKEKEGQT
jgi:hypothetical protein